MTEAEILRARARAAAAPPPEPEAGERLEILEFTLGSETYGLETRWVREVRMLQQLTPVPGIPSFIAGVMSLRGEVLPVVDLRGFFGLPVTGISELNRLVILGSARPELAVLADSVVGLRSLLVAALRPGLATLTGVREQFLLGVTADMVAVLDGARLLADVDLRMVGREG